MRLTLPLLFAISLNAQVSIAWTPLGPHHINGKGSAVESGKIQALAVFPGDANVMYAGGGNGSGSEGPPAQAGVFKTSDGGAHWTSITHGMSDPLVNALYVDPANQNLVLAGTEFDGIYRSTDGGANWTRIGTYGATSDFLAFNGAILAAVSTGIVQSTDGGATWTSILSGNAPVRTLAAGGGVLIAGTDSGAVLVQTRAGAQFQAVLTAQRPVWSVAIDPNAPNIMYAVMGVSQQQPTPVLMTSTNSGQSWTSVTVGQMPQAVTIAPATHTVYVGASDGLFASTDSGATWRQANTGRWDVRRIFWSDSSKTLYLGVDQGLHRSTDQGSTFTDLSGAMPNAILMAVAVRGSTIVTAVQDFDPIVSYDAGATWTQLSWTSGGLPVGETGPAAVNGSYCYVFTQPGFQYSTDGCKTFKMTNAAQLRNNAWVMPGNADVIAAAPSNPSTVYVGAQAGVLASSDSGVTMSLTSWPLKQVTAIAVNPADAKSILVGTTAGLSRTTDGGATWSSVAIPASGYPQTIAYDPANPAIVLVGLSMGTSRGGGMLRSTDGGATLRVSNAGIPTPAHLPPCCNVDMLSVRFNSAGVAALGTRTGAYLSFDQGQTWQDITANSVATYFSDVAWDGGYLYASTYGGGVLRTQVPTATLTVTAQNLTFTAGDAAQSIALSASGGGAPFSATASTDSGGAWLSVTPGTGTAPATLTASVNAAGLVPGVYTGKIVIASTASLNGPITIAVQLNVPGVLTVQVTSIVNGGSYLPGIAPNTWVTVYGVGLSDTARTWGASDFIGGNLPTNLDGVSVSMGSLAAYVYYVSPGQLNVLAPAGIASGSVPLVVRNAHGSSAPASATAAGFAPAFFLFGPQLPAATHADGSLIGPPDQISGATPAKPGETIVLYGTGFGDTTPPTPAGIVAIAVAPLANQAAVSIGGAPATVAFAGIIGAGLYQLNVVVPGVADGNQTMNVTIGGVRSPDTLLAVAK